MPAGSRSLGVDWHLPDPRTGAYRRRSFASTTVASSNLVRALAREGLTWAEVVDAILYDSEARAVAERFVAEGFGAVPAATHLRLH